MASRVFPIRILLFIFAQWQLGSCGFDCPGPIMPPHGLSYARIESNITGRVSQEYAKLRIELIMDPTIENKPYKGLVQEAANFWMKVLSVKRVDGRLFMSQNCESEAKTFYKKLDGSGERKKYCMGSCATETKCIEIEVPSKHLDGCNYCTQEKTKCKENGPEPGAGVENADTVFYVTARDTDKCGDSTVAYAGACDIEPSQDRPVFAVINVCPTNAASHSDDNKAMLRAIKHEMMHALGFATNLFAYFRHQNGTPLWERDDDEKPIPFEKNPTPTVLKAIKRKWHVRGEPIDTTRLYLVTPSVVREARAHFGCTNLEGAEMEDIPREGSQYSHFEARVFYDDAMKPNMDNGKGLFSKVSFAVLEDSGWYQVDYSHAEAMDYGKKLGCDFCMKSCKFWMDKKRKEGTSLDPYCDSPDLVFKKGVTCIGPKKLFTGCPLTPLSSEFIKLLHGPNSFDLSYELPRKYQHFDEISNVPDYQVPQSGSFDAYADCCPIPVENYDATQLLGYAYHCEDEAKDDEDRNEEDESNESSSLGLSAMWLFLFHLIVILI